MNREAWPADILEIIGPETVSAAELGEWLGLTGNRVNALARKGAIPRHGQNRFELRPAIRAYCEHMRTGQTGRLATNPDLQAEKVRLARANAEKVELQNARLRGDLLDARQVAREWRSVIVDLRAAVLAVPSRVASRLGLDRGAAAALDAEVREAMEMIANAG